MTPTAKAQAHEVQAAAQRRAAEAAVDLLHGILGDDGLATWGLLHDAGGFRFGPALRSRLSGAAWAAPQIDSPSEQRGRLGNDE
jgi:hypothetical protein